LYELQAERQRLASRSKELVGVIATQRKQHGDMTAAVNALLARGQRVQAAVSALQGDQRELTTLVAALDASLLQDRNATAAVTAQRNAANNATVFTLFTAAGVRRQLYALSSEIAGLKTALAALQRANETAARNADRNVVGDDALAALGLVDDLGAVPLDGKGLYDVTDELEAGTATQSQLEALPRFAQAVSAMEEADADGAAGSVDDAWAGEWLASGDAVGHAAAWAEADRQGLLSLQQGGLRGAGRRRRRAGERDTLARFRALGLADQAPSAGSRGGASTVQPSFEAQRTALRALVVDLQSRINSLTADNERVTGAIRDMMADADTFRRRLEDSQRDKAAVAAEDLDAKARFDGLREKVFALHEGLQNSSMALAAVQQDIDEMTFNAAQLGAEEGAARDRLKAAEEETARLEKRRQEMVAAITKAADDRVEQTQALKKSIRDLLATRRGVAQDIAQQQTARLLAAEQVDYLQQQVRSLEARRAEMEGAVTDLTAGVERSKRQRAVVTQELANALARTTRVKLDLPKVLSQRETVAGIVRKEEAEVVALRASITTAQLDVKAAEAEVSRLTAERKAMNARIAETKLKAEAARQAAVDGAEARGAAAVEVDRLRAAKRERQAALDAGRRALADLQAALGRAEARRVRSAANLADLQRQARQAQALRDKLAVATGSAAPSPSPQGTTNSTAPATAPSASPAATSAVSRDAVRAQVNALRQAVVARVEAMAALDGKGKP